MSSKGLFLGKDDLFLNFSLLINTLSYCTGQFGLGSLERVDKRVNLRNTES